MGGVGGWGGLGWANNPGNARAGGNRRAGHIWCVRLLQALQCFSSNTVIVFGCLPAQHVSPTQCWTNRPLPAHPLAQLRRLAALGGNLAPALPLLAHELEASTQQLSFLPWASTGLAGGARNEVQAVLEPLHKDALTWYTQQAALCTGPWGANPRHQLTGGEHVRLLGQPQPLPPPQPDCLRRKLCAPTSVQPCPVAYNIVANYEQALAKLVIEPPAAAAAAAAAATATAASPAIPLYPLRPLNPGKPLEVEMHRELKASWDLHHALPRPTQVVPGCGKEVKRMLLEVCQHREQVESWLLHSIFDTPASLGCYGCSARLARLGGSAASGVSLQDLLRAMLDPAFLPSLNPFLSDTARKKVWEGVVVWGALCVLEDRLGRLEALTQDKATMQGHMHTLIQVGCQCMMAGASAEAEVSLPTPATSLQTMHPYIYMLDTAYEEVC